MGHAARATASTDANERSSRSHAVITINIDSHAAGATAARSGKVGAAARTGQPSSRRSPRRALRTRVVRDDESGLTCMCAAVCSSTS
eukprot:6208530-Prymnesium_polylepis.1